MKITYDQIRASDAVKTYILAGNDALGTIGFTEHGLAHATKAAVTAADILAKLGYDERTVEHARIAGYLHDIGNMVNRNDHALLGGTISFSILNSMGADPADIAVICAAIGNHDETSGQPVNPVAAALALADKSDVRRTRVRPLKAADGSFISDIHDRVNYAAIANELVLDVENSSITLKLTIDTAICAVMDYFEIFLKRMLMSRRAAEYLGLVFHLDINGTLML
ncbi:MAG: HD domain-containing protein [Clostridia bacterium]|nr:HD domain-containing protein [Clostridia bacterium]